MTLEQKLNAIQDAKARVTAAMEALARPTDAADMALGENEAVVEGRDGLVYVVQQGKVQALGPFKIRGFVAPALPVAPTPPHAVS